MVTIRSFNTETYSTPNCLREFFSGAPNKLKTLIQALEHIDQPPGLSYRTGRLWL